MVNLKSSFVKFTLLAVLVVSGCDAWLLGKSNEDLLKDINEYYFLEMNERWEEVYEHRVSEFRSGVDKQYFVIQMSEDNAGWNLLKWDVLEIDKKSDSHAVVVIEFREAMPEAVAREFGRQEGDAITFRQWTDWRKQDGRWLCRDCGMRMRLSLNSGV